MCQRRNQKGNQTLSWAKENGNTTYQNSWDAKSVPWGQFIVINAYIKKR